MSETGMGREEPAWRAAETEFSVDLYGVVQTVEGPFAIGGSGTLAADVGGGWEVVFDDGPATRQAQLRAIDVTDDGRRVWMVGSSGVLACYDVEQNRKFDYSYPDEMTSTWEAIAVAGEKGHEKVLAANGSGEVLPFTVAGFDVNFGRLDKPVGKGSNIAALSASPDGVGYAIDTSGNAFKTSQEEGWEDIGLLDAQLKLYDIHAGANQRVYVTAGNGTVYRYDDSPGDWTPIGVSDGVSIRAIDVKIEDDEGEMMVVGGDGSLYQRTGDERWLEIPSPVGATLFDLSIGETDVAVGKDGTVIERPNTLRHPRDSPDGDAYDGRGEMYDQPTDERRSDGSGSADDGAESGSASQEGAESGSEDDDGAEAGSADGEGADSGGESDDGASGSDTDDDSGARADGTADAEGSADTRLEDGEVLVLLASRLDIGALSSASGYNIDDIEAALVEVAEDVAVDADRVRAALDDA